MHLPDLPQVWSCRATRQTRLYRGAFSAWGISEATEADSPEGMSARGFAAWPKAVFIFFCFRAAFLTSEGFFFRSPRHRALQSLLSGHLCQTMSHGFQKLSSQLLLRQSDHHLDVSLHFLFFQLVRVYRELLLPGCTLQVHREREDTRLDAGECRSRGISCTFRRASETFSSRAVSSAADLW